MKKTLFICNTNYLYGEQEEKIFSGLYNSASMVSDMLNGNDVLSAVVRVIDSNGIDRQVHNFRPNFVIIEALWVPVEKLKELIRLHPSVIWVIRIHSEVPFLANEGNAIELISEYKKLDNVIVSCNSERSAKDLCSIYLPNYYKRGYDNRTLFYNSSQIKIGCFGSIRPMKNQLIQAMAAIKFADEKGLCLNFHINSSRVEQGGNSVLKNLRALFLNSDHSLVEHEWLDPVQFKTTLCGMDLGMQVSFSETFNIVSADMVDCGLPIVVSKEVSWADSNCFADPNSVDSIVKVMHKVWNKRKRIIKNNYRRLREFSQNSEITWLDFLS